MTPDSPLVIGSQHNAGIYIPMVQGVLDAGLGWSLLSATVDPRGSLWCVGTANNAGMWNPDTRTYTPSQSAFGWGLRCLAWQSPTEMWCVGSAGNIGQWEGDWTQATGGWVQCAPNVGTWLMITFDDSGGQWGVRDDNTLQKWNQSSSQWEPQHDTTNLLMVAFDSAGTMWSVTTENTAQLWNGAEWVVQDLGWSVSWLTFRGASVQVVDWKYLNSQDRKSVV